MNTPEAQANYEEITNDYDHLTVVPTSARAEKALKTAAEGGAVDYRSGDDGKLLCDCFVLPEGSTAKDFACYLHPDIGDGFLHAIDCRSERRIGADRVLENRDVVEIVSTNQ